MYIYIYICVITHTSIYTCVHVYLLLCVISVIAYSITLNRRQCHTNAHFQQFRFTLLVQYNGYFIFSVIIKEIVLILGTFIKWQ